MKAADIFIQSLPSRPYCSNDLERGVYPNNRDRAAAKKFVQPNAAAAKNWLTFDLDYEDAYFAFESKDVPVPSFAAVNRKNGHAHYGYLLNSPVFFTDRASKKPQDLMCLVRRGLTAKLEADRGYTETVCKNPLHCEWEVEWNIHRPYSLDELRECLSDEHLAPGRVDQIETACLGRNSYIFETVRHQAYRHVDKFRKDPYGYERFLDFVDGLVSIANSKFPAPLPLREAFSTAKSISKWTWKNYNGTGSRQCDSEAQRDRVLKRWAKQKLENPGMASLTKPWESEGISRRTWYSRKKQNTSLQTGAIHDGMSATDGEVNFNTKP